MTSVHREALADSTTSEEILLRCDDAGSRRAVVLEDDGRVAYAYLLDGERLTGDVWLYNVSPTPETVDWKDRSQMPFLNPKKYCQGETSPRLHARSRVDCEWSDAGVDVSIDGIVMAKLENGSKPGWSRLALQPGPLAKPLR